MQDILERLRSSTMDSDKYELVCLCVDAQDELTRLRADLEAEMRRALHLTNALVKINTFAERALYGTN